MNFSQKLGLLILIVIAVAYVYFSFFAAEGFHFNVPQRMPAEEHDNYPFMPSEEEEAQPPVSQKKSTIKTVKIFVANSDGKLRSVNRECDTAVQKSCFEFAIKELLQAPSKWEKSKGFTSEIPAGTKMLSVREGEGSIMIDLSSAFEAGGGAESTYTRVLQIIKTARANTNLPVYLYINGKQADVIGGEGIMIKQPLSEKSLEG